MGGSAAGGTGQTFDWTIAKTIQEGGLPLFVAGGASLTSARRVRETGVRKRRRRLASLSGWSARAGATRADAGTGERVLRKRASYE